MTATRTKILPRFFDFDRLSLVSPSKRYLHKWPQNTSFLPAPPAKQVKHRNSLRNCYLISPVYQVLLLFSLLSLCLSGKNAFVFLLCVSAIKFLSLRKPRQIQIAQIRPTGFLGQITQLHRHTLMCIVGNPHRTIGIHPLHQHHMPMQMVGI